MENHPASLDTAFRALADPTRRAVVSRLIAIDQLGRMAERLG